MQGQIDLKKHLDLDSILHVEENSLSAQLDDGTLTICCYNLFNISEKINYNAMMSKIETYVLEDKIQKITVYQLDKSFIKTYFNAQPEVKRLDLVSGTILSNDVLTKSEIKLGMSKDKVLSTFFKPTGLFAKINCLKLYENELGEAWTIFIFEENRLSEIKFDSSYDWINKGL
jgi:hypothetical protein